MDANINDPVAATDPRQDDYDIWLGTESGLSTDLAYPSR